MSLSVYVHIPYCLQRCRYCDFTTFEQSEILPPERYVGQVLREIQNRHRFWSEREIGTLYFGGGTPS
jgi:oxygen-independent coproporphyrinogen-3 oxidase